MMSATYISTVWFKRAKSSTGKVTQRFNKFTASTLKIDIYRLYENPIYTSQTLRTMMVTGATIGSHGKRVKWAVLLTNRRIDTSDENAMSDDLASRRRMRWFQ